jgi:hypothetical protein
MHRSRQVSLLLAVLVVTLTHYADPRRTKPEPLPWERLGTQVATLALTVLARRYPARRPQLLLAAAVVGSGVGLLGQRRRRREGV